MQIFNFRCPSLGRNWSVAKENRTKSTTTYAFLLRIVQGASYQHPEQIETVALFNESCNRNYISSKFAKNRLQILDDNTEEDVDGDCWLVWVCEGLGRYQQRTVFWIAQDADFDLLFGYEQNQNTLDHQNQQFQNGINNGTLKTDLRGWKSFQGGIKDDFLLPVGRAADGDYLSGSPPSLADIKGQLAVQLGSSSERKQQHDREKALNTFDSRHIIDQANFFCGEDPNDSTAPVLIEMPERDKINLLGSATTAMDDSKQPINSNFKGNKRTHHEPQSSSAAGEPDEVYRLPKVRNVRIGCPCRCVAANLPNDGIPAERENLDANGNLLSSDSNSLCAASAEEHPTISHGPEISRELPEGSPSRRSTAGTEEELLFSGMERDDSPCTSTVSRASSSISLSSKGLDTQSISKEPDTIKADVHDPTYQPKRKTKKGKRKRRPKIIGKSLVATADCHDKKFHEYWKRDKAKGNWYHVDKATSKVTWYEAPPWSTSPSGANDILSNTSSFA
ncbi:hypothetical protein L207DRAFT_510217 [Hyaloscypha variabilis F]|uniref:Uncharacterized protein n=1 Tax=Hyaloscypha variabilis (strain UAMH 11265 / GT02V1 / F) TaxID=1149755 RepID=A0A2J6RYX6_HYAVF|nr:hypothetical protein L207DRAFT_510217 [Hyaloscypha variabilis F]